MAWPTFISVEVMRAPEVIERSQKRLFRSLENELALLKSSSGKEIKAYERAFLRSLPRRISSSTKTELLKACQSAKIILMGDFHSFRQSQKGFLRLVQEVRHKNTSTIALECVFQEQQPLLDHFLAGNITTQELREGLDFDKHWPFPWNNYKEIFEYAKKNRLYLLALNIKKNKNNSMLKARDVAAAEKLIQYSSANPRKKVFVLYGELHLGRDHLPAQLKSKFKKKLLVVHQNETSLYWRAPQQKNGQRVEVLKLRNNEYCVLNAVPWVKLRSYLDWMEGSIDESWQEEFNVEESILEFTQLLADTLEIPINPSTQWEILAPQQITTPPKHFTPEEKTLFQHAAKFHRTTIIPQQGVLLLPSLSTNALTEAASLLLWRKQFTKHPKSRMLNSNALVLQFLLGYLGSKILNPKRKCNEIADIRSFLQNHRSKTSFEKKKRAVFQRTLTILSPFLALKAKKTMPLSGPLEIEACRLAGYILANRLFLGLSKNAALVRLTQKAYQTSNASEKWAERILKEISKSTKKISPPSKSSAF